MSFGFSISDCITVTQLARSVYKRCRNARGEFKDLSRDVESLHLVLGRVREEAERPQSLLNQQATSSEINKIVGNCEEVLKQIDALVTKYGKSGKPKTGAWFRLTMPTGADLTTIRGKLTTQTAAVSVYLETLGLGGIGRTERKLEDLGGQLPEIKNAIDKMAAEMRAGRREGSVMTTHTNDDQQVWRELRRELIGEGYSSKTIGRFKVSIKAYIKELDEKGLLDEEAVDSDGAPTSDEDASKNPSKDAIDSENSPPSSAEYDGPSEESPAEKEQAASSTGSEGRAKSPPLIYSYGQTMKLANDVYWKCHYQTPTLLSLYDVVYAFQVALYSHDLDPKTRVHPRDERTRDEKKLETLHFECYTALQSAKNFLDIYYSFDHEEERLDWSVSTTMEDLTSRLMTCTSKLYTWDLSLPDLIKYESHCCMTCLQRQGLCTCLVSVGGSLPALIEHPTKGSKNPYFHWKDPRLLPIGWYIYREDDGRYLFIDTLARECDGERRYFRTEPICEQQEVRLPKDWTRIVSPTGRVRYRQKASKIEIYGHPSNNPYIQNDQYGWDSHNIEQKAPCQIVPVVWKYPLVAHAIVKNHYPGLEKFEDVKNALESSWHLEARRLGCHFQVGRSTVVVNHLTHSLVERMHQSGGWGGTPCAFEADFDTKQLEDGKAKLSPAPRGSPSGLFMHLFVPGKCNPESHGFHNGA